MHPLNIFFSGYSQSFITITTITSRTFSLPQKETVHISSHPSFTSNFLSPAAAKSLQSCPTLCHPIDGSPPGSPVPGILQASVLYCAHLYMKCSLGISNFLEEISSLSHSDVFLYVFSYSLRKAFLSLLAIIGKCAFRWVYLSFSPLLSFLFFLSSL